MPDSYAAASAQFHLWAAENMPVLLADPWLHALAAITRELDAGARAEIARLRAELDRYQGREVFYCTDAQATEAQGLIEPVPGTVLRATDTGREWEFTPAGWEHR